MASYLSGLLFNGLIIRVQRVDSLFCLRIMSSETYIMLKVWGFLKRKRKLGTYFWNRCKLGDEIRLTLLLIIMRGNLYFHWLGLSSQELFKAQGNKKVLRQLVSLYNQGILVRIHFFGPCIFFTNNNLSVQVHCFLLCRSKCITTWGDKPS